MTKPPPPPPPVLLSLSAGTSQTLKRSHVRWAHTVRQHASVLLLLFVCARLPVCARVHHKSLKECYQQHFSRHIREIRLMDVPKWARMRNPTQLSDEEDFPAHSIPLLLAPLPPSSSSRE